MLDEIIALASVSSHSLDRVGLKAAEAYLTTHFSSLGKVESIPLSYGNLLHISRERNAPLQLLFVGHYDTVYPSLFPIIKEGDRLFGPGVADMKGGIILMLHLLRWLESTPLKESIGWEVLLSPDEETGSCDSRAYLEKAAIGKTLGLIFEPSLPSGAIVGERPGSATYLIEAQGKGGHAGRGAKEGRNALVALAEVAVALAALQNPDQGIIVNPAKMSGGEASNLIPDKASLLVNIRTPKEELPIQEIIEAISKRREVAFDIHEKDGKRPPRPLLEKSRCYIALLGLPAQPSWGVSDSNLLEAVGLPTLDGLGPTGFDLHSSQESLLIPSLSPRLEALKAFLERLTK